MIDMLPDTGRDIKATNMNQSTPLHLAAAYGEEGIVKHLLAKGADPLLVDFEGMNTLQQAERQEAVAFGDTPKETRALKHVPAETESEFYIERRERVRDKFQPVKELLKLALENC